MPLIAGGGIVPNIVGSKNPVFGAGVNCVTFASSKNNQYVISAHL